MKSATFSILGNHNRPVWVVIALSCSIVLLNGQYAIAQTQPLQKPSPEVERLAVAEGRPIFESMCAACHGLDGRGGERGPDVATRQQAIQLSDRELLEVMQTGRPAAGMPPFNSLGATKLTTLLAYLRSLQGKSETDALPGDPSRGKLLFFGRARCAECHMVQGEGGFLGNDLSSYGATFSSVEIRSNILRASDNPVRANKIVLVTMRDAQKFTGVIRNEDNFSIQLQSLNGSFHFLDRSEVTQLDFLPGTIMPGDYRTTLKPAQLDDLVSFLLATAKSRESGHKAIGEDSE